MWPMAIGMGLQGLGALFGGGGSQKPTQNQEYIDYFTGRLREQQRNNQMLQNQLMSQTLPQQVERYGLQNTGYGLQNTGLQQLINQRGFGFQQKGKVYDVAKGLLGQDIYNPQKTLDMAMLSIKPLLDRMKGDFAQRGIGGGAESSGLANLALQASLGHLMRGYESNAYQTSQRDQNLLRLMGGLYG